jgi:hypothetical protein
MSQKRYPKEVFIRSLIFSLIVILLAVVSTNIMMQNKKNEIVKNVQLSAEYITEK